MAAPAKERVAVVFAEEMYETTELHYPRLRLIEAGFKVHVVGPQKDVVYKSKEGYWARSNAVVAEIDPRAVDVVVVPGGFCTDRLRRFPDICEWLRAAWNEGRGAVVGLICHAGWLAISANILRGRRGTCFFAIKDDMRNAGMDYVETERCVRDGRLVTAQTPEDLPAFMATILEAVADGK